MVLRVKMGSFLRIDPLFIGTERGPSPIGRPEAIYERSLELLKRAKEYAPEIPTKSGLMVGLGETKEQLIETFKDLVAHKCDALTIGQYLQPSKEHL